MTKANRRRPWALGLTIALIAACTSPVDDCAGVGVDGIRLTVVDSLTGLDLSPVATVTVTQLSPPFASATGSLSSPPSPLDVAADRPGSYSVSVAAEGYQTWTATVQVLTDTGRCAQTVTTNVTARLLTN